MNMYFWGHPVLRDEDNSLGLYEVSLGTKGNQRGESINAPCCIRSKEADRTFSPLQLESKYVPILITSDTI